MAKEDIKGMVVVVCVFITITCLFFTILSIGKYETVANENEFLNKQIKEQSMLIDYLKGNTDK